MTTARLGRRLDMLEDTLLQRRATELAREYGLIADELLPGMRVAVAEERRLRNQGLPEPEIMDRFLTWAADTLGVDRNEVRAEWEKTLRERSRCEAT